MATGRGSLRGVRKVRSNYRSLFRCPVEALRRILASVLRAAVEGKHSGLQGHQTRAGLDTPSGPRLWRVLNWGWVTVMGRRVRGQRLLAGSMVDG
jgi:hypothetical protein